MVNKNEKKKVESSVVAVKRLQYYRKYFVLVLTFGRDDGTVNVDGLSWAEG